MEKMILIYFSFKFIKNSVCTNMISLGAIDGSLNDLKTI